MRIKVVLGCATVLVATAFPMLPASADDEVKHRDDTVKLRDDDVKLRDLPAAARTTINRETRGGKIEDIERKVKPDNTVYFEVEWEKGDIDHELHVDAKGKILRHDQDENAAVGRR